MEYKWVVDGVMEDLIDNAAADPSPAECTAKVASGNMLTDYANYANRKWLLGDGNVEDYVDACSAPTPEPLTIKVLAPAGTTGMHLTGPWWNWDLAQSPVAVDLGNDVWAATFTPPPGENMEYKWVADGSVWEDILDDAQADKCISRAEKGTINTDYSNYANRLWLYGTDNVVTETFGSCYNVDDVVTLTVKTSPTATSVRLTGPWWGWDPNGGPEAVANGDATWTVTLDPAPTANMEYLWVVDGVQENLIDNAAADPAPAECTAKVASGNLVTDYFGYANRRWLLGDGNVSDAYEACVSQ